MGRPAPLGHDVDEWRLWLAEHAGCGLGYLAENIVAAKDRNIAGRSPVRRSGDSPRASAASNPASDFWPKIVNRITTEVSPWVDLVAREVEFSPGAEPQLYHSVATFDYVIVLAVTPDGRIPLVRQYRPAVEEFTLEFPAGIVDSGEDPAVTASRELLEETGLPTESIHLLAVNKTDAGRLSNRVHSYFVQTGPRLPDFEPEAGLAVRLVTSSELVRLIREGEFDAQANLGTLLLAVLLGHLKLPD
jgi:8-oxo-dGTP pyrophosphatase MutT (NUDIX family)